MIAAIEPNSPAGRAELMSGDLIIALDEVAITGADDLIRSLTGDKIGRTITIDVVRLGKRRRFSLIPEERRRS